jgi:hypothetical protein
LRTGFCGEYVDLKRDEITEEWRNVCNELHILYSSPNVIRQTKTRRMKWVGNVACVGKIEKSVQGRKKESSQKTEA